MPDASPQVQPIPAEHQKDAPPNGDMQSLVNSRRSRLSDAQRPASDSGTWGLALSGGGIRSATFCFGLLKALAKNQVFHRFDMLSTVSGGGYIGATVGRLYHDAARTGQPAHDVEAAIADADTRWFAFWLRANGRYLIPRGGKDLLFAAANFGRNLIGVHIELALLCLLLGSLLVGFDLALWQWADCLYSRNACWHPDWVTMDTLDALSRWPSLWIPIPLLLLLAASLATAYWVLPAKPREGLSLQRWIATALCLAGCWKLATYWTVQKTAVVTTDGLQLPGWLVLVAGGVLLSWIIGSVIAQFLTHTYPDSPDLSRNRLTSGLAHILKAGSVILVLGLVDVMAWLLANSSTEHQGAIGTAVVLAVVALRTVLPKIADLPRSLTPGTRINLNGLINLAGLSVILLLLVFWVSIVHRSVTLALFDDIRRVLQFSLGWSWLALISLPVVLMIGISFTNRDFLNRSSLYTFYRARLVRAYLGAGNVARFGGHQQAATGSCQRHEIANARLAVQDVHADDDVAMAEYVPHLGGGPVHLINACVNQTRDPRGGLFNQDRKGLPITIGPQGRVRVGDGDWRAVEKPDSLTLGSWMAISGAAVAPGLGSSTKPGIASLLTMSGIRLGYWWNTQSLSRDAGAAVSRSMGKYAQLLAELQGRFDGTKRADWYLSDGGHFENTAAYALLREECALVVVADCGADPRYAFGDLENLVRKARIDLQAEITFLKPRMPRTATAGTATDQTQAGQTTPLHDAKAARPSTGKAPPSATAHAAPTIFGSLNDLASADSQACLALARIDYRTGKAGYMVVVKPNMCAGVPVDLVNFKADRPLFPQEPTTDQFFSEAQWESYFHLGYTMGLHLQRQMLDDLPRFASNHFELDDGSVAVRNESGEVHAAAAPKRLPSRIAATGAVTASVSLGALVTLGATAWQAVDQQMKAREDARKMDPAALKELTDLYGKLMPDASPTVNSLADTPTPIKPTSPAVTAGADKSSTRLGEMATALLRVGDAACTLDNTEAFRRSVLMQMIITSTKRSCREAIPRHPACDVLLDEDRSVACLHAQTQVNCGPRYWLRDFGQTDPARQNCLNTPPPAPSPSTSTSDPAASPSSNPAPAPPASSGPESTAPSEDSKSAQDPEACKSKTVYIQIFGPELRDRVRLLREPWRELGASVPPVEDVLDTARRRGRNAPQAPAQPTVIFHDSGSEACARQLPPPDKTSPWSIRSLSPQLKGTPGTIEVWIPPLPALTSGLAASAQAAPAAQVTPPPSSAFCYQEDSKQKGSQRFGVHCHADAISCNSARGPNSHRVQTACLEIQTSAVADILNRRGWGGSWYAFKAAPFGQPFPNLE